MKTYTEDLSGRDGITKDLPSQEVVQKALDYNPKTGEFTWKHSIGRARKGEVAGFINARGYLVISLYGELYVAHRLAFAWMGVALNGIVDHIDCNKLNNAWDNLRQVSHTQNTRNRSKPSSSGHHNIYAHPSKTKGTRYKVFIKKGTKIHASETFNTLAAAIQFRDQILKEINFK